MSDVRAILAQQDVTRFLRGVWDDSAGILSNPDRVRHLSNVVIEICATRVLPAIIPPRELTPFGIVLESALWQIRAQMLARSDHDPALAGQPYWYYLSGTHWRELRARMLARAGGYCQRCNAQTQRLEVHHLTYLRLGRELEADLIVLCRACHAAEHGVAA